MLHCGRQAFRSGSSAGRKKQLSPSQGQAMASYRFRYANLSGGVIRTTAMQCQTDAEAIQKAQGIMQEPYTRLEIFEDDRTVYSHTHQESFALS
jgi:hypothetical protein